MKKVVIGLMAIVFTMLVIFDAMCVSRTIGYLNRGFGLRQALEWTEADMDRIIRGEPKEEESEVKEYPLVNANVSWSQTWHKGAP